MALSVGAVFPLQVKKALELQEQLRQRMGVVVVGPSGAGKSTLWRMLRAALGKTGKVVRGPRRRHRLPLTGSMLDTVCVQLSICCGGAGDCWDLYKALDMILMC